MKSNNLLPKVSVICLCYNHEKYIKEALNSIIMQKTNFAFEIIVHDDASTDNSALIIKEYYSRYPNIIVPILQTENQYSKKISINNTHIYPKVRGKYIALCECDDYWVDKFKLQKQVDYLEKHKDCSICIHAAYMIDAKTKQLIKKIVLSNSDRDFTMADAIEGIGSVAATNSFVYRSKYIKNIIDCSKELPKTGVGDYLIVILLGIYGKIHYINEFMSCYRSNVENSWTYRMNDSIYDYLRYLDNHILLLEKLYLILPEYTHKVLTNEIKREKFKVLIIQGKLFDAKEKFPSLYKQLTLSKKFKIVISYILLHFDNNGYIYNNVIKIYRYFRKLIKNDFKFS